MARSDPISKAFAITDHSLREFFPADFYKRCMYATFGMAALLRDEGACAQVIGGDFLCAVVSDDGMRLSLQGFGTTGAGEPSHFWVHAQGTILDLGPMYLPYESPYSAPPPPLLRWPLAVPLPSFIAYRERVRYADNVEIANSEFRQRSADFVQLCRATSRLKSDEMRPQAWQLRDYQSLRYAAQKGDPWARAATEFLRRSLKAEFPEKVS